jgi:hypothetical protein
MRLALQRRVNSRGRKLRVLPVILPGGLRAKESELPGFLQGTTWVEFRRSLDEEDALRDHADGLTILCCMTCALLLGTDIVLQKF